MISSIMFLMWQQIQTQFPGSGNGIHLMLQVREKELISGLIFIRQTILNMQVKYQRAIQQIRHLIHQNNLNLNVSER